MEPPNWREADLRNLDITDLKRTFKALDEYTRRQLRLTSNKEIAKHIGMSEAYYSRTLNPDNDDYSLEVVRRNTLKFATNVGAMVMVNDGVYEARPSSRAQAAPMKSRDGRLYFVYYHVSDQPTAEFSIRMSLLWIDPKAKESQLLNYRGSNGRNGHAEGEFPGFNSGYQGKVQFGEKTTYLHLNQKINRMTASAEVPSFTVINANISTIIEEEEFIACTYNSYHPACGIALIEQIGRDDIDARFASQTIPAEVGATLFNHRFSPNLYPTGVFEARGKRTLVNKVRDYEGAYLGYILHERKSGESISEIKFRIYDGYKIAFYAAPRGNEVKGYIVQFEGNQMICRLGYKYNSRHFDISINLETRYQENIPGVSTTMLGGVFSLIGHTSKRPAAGRILLVRADEKYADLSSVHISLQNAKELNKLTTKRPYLLPFFAGEYDWFADTPLKHQNPAVRDAILNQGAQVQAEVHEDIQSLAGLYLTLRLSTDRDRVYQRPTEIFAGTGDVVRRIRYSPTRGDVSLFGQAQMVGDDALSIDFGLRLRVAPNGVKKEMPESRSTLIGLHRRFDRSAHPLRGLSTRLSGDGDPITFREYFFPVREKTHHRDLVADWSLDNLPSAPEHRELVEKMLRNPDQYLMMEEKVRGW